MHGIPVGAVVLRRVGGECVTEVRGGEREGIAYFQFVFVYLLLLLPPLDCDFLKEEREGGKRVE